MNFLKTKINEHNALLYFISKKAEGRISKGKKQENKAQQIFRKKTFLLHNRHTYAYQENKQKLTYDCLLLKHYSRKRWAAWNKKVFELLVGRVPTSILQPIFKCSVVLKTTILAKTTIKHHSYHYCNILISSYYLKKKIDYNLNRENFGNISDNCLSLYDFMKQI